MPLRLLKRNRKQYNVVSKSTFVISVELLDNGIMECTLDAESTGRDCLLNISQRLGLHQPEFFGLRYISRGVPPRQRWVELDRPLRKQLEKHAQDSQLSLGIMFYVNDVNVLKDEMARYHYFLQLKSDVIDGKLNCSIEQAISLAAYSLQAEFGDFDPERHTVEYLRDFAILPKELISQQKYPEINVDGLYEAVVRQYASLIGFPPPLAEIYYIMVAQQLDGYGQEPYPAKDDAGNDILICVSANGLLIRRRDWTHIAAFRWSDIKSLIGHKRLFVVESSQSHRTMQYHFTDAEVAKYVRKMCILQSTFYKENIQPDATNENIRNNNYSSPTYDQVDGSSYRCLNIGTTPDLIAQNLSGSTPGSSYSLHNTSWNPLALGNSLNSSGFNMQLLAPHLQISSSEMNQLSFHPSNQDLLHGNNGMSSETVLTQIQAHPDIRANGVPLTGHLSTGSTGLSSLSESGEMHSLLHGYGRAVSDYTTALQLKYGNAIPDLSAPKSSSQLYFSNQRKNSNEDEPIYQNEIVSQMHSMELRDSLSNSASEVNGTSNSASSLSPNEDVHAYVYKPPPPYPGLNAKQDKISSESSNSNLSLSKENGSCAVFSKLSPSATSVVSAQVHTEPSSSTSSLLKSDVENGNETDKCDPIVKEEDRKYALEGSKVVPEIAVKKEEIKILKEPGRGNMPTNKAGQLFGKPIDPSVLREFQVIPKAKSNPNFSTALKRENSKRNRSPEVLPYEDNAIRLNPTRQNPSGYINASPLSIGIGDKQWKYIVAQIPLTGNGPALWQMIWETDVKVIVSLERDSSALFYPPQKGAAMSFNDFQIVESKVERSSTASIAREFTVTLNQKKKQRKVWILPYEEEWKDDVPIHTEHFLCFLEEVNSIQRRVSEPATPLTVLCGTGAGKSGIFILSDLLLHAADSGHKLRCDSLLGDLRTQRMSLVSTASQYAFVLHTLAKYLAQSRLI